MLLNERWRNGERERQRQKERETNRERSEQLNTKKICLHEYLVQKQP